MKLAAIFRDMPIRRKLTLIAVLATGVALIVAALVSMVSQWFLVRGELVRTTTSQATIVAVNSTSAMLFNDPKAADQTLAALGVQGNIKFAELHDKEGKPFALFMAAGQKPPQVDRPPTDAQYIFTATYLDVFLPIVFKGERVGSIHVRSSLDQVYSQMAWNAALVVAAAAAGLGVALILISYLHPAITGPLNRLAGLMGEVSRDKNYGLRAVFHGKDELGVLARGLNDMLAQIQLRDETLAQHRLHLEQEVAQRTAKLTEAQRIAHLGNWEWDVVNNTLDWSDEIYRIFGLTPREFGANYEAFLQAVYPEDRRDVDARVREALEGGRPYSVDHRVLLPDGSLRHVHEQAEVFSNSDGRPVKMMGTVQDITEAKLAENALHESEASIRALVEKSPIAMLVDVGVEADEKIILMNQRFTDLFGYTLEHVPDVRHWWPLAYPDEKYREEIRVEWIGRVEKAIQSRGDIEPMESAVTCKDGSSRYVRVGLASVGNRNIVTFEDLTVRMLAEEKIRKLNEELEEKVQVRTQQLVAAQDELVRKEKLAVLGQVAGSVGHELRNPLGVMSNAVYFLQTVLSEADATTKDYLGIIKEEIAGAERIVADLLDSVRTKPPQAEAVGVKELIGKTLRKCNIPAGVGVNLEIPDTLPPLRVDQLQIHQVLRNLIVNGIDAMPEGGTLEISATEDTQAKAIVVSVRDTGCGMTPEQLAKLFQPLFTTKARGIGLGLVVVKNLTQANGGTVVVHSQPGQGSIFSITLPATDEKEDQHA